MGSSSNGIIWVELDLSHYTDKNRTDLIAGITQNAPKSPLWANQPIQDAVTSLAKLGPALTSANQLVATDEGKLAADRKARDATRGDTDKGLMHYRNLVQNFAVSESEVTSANLKVRQRSQTIAPPDPPPGLTVLLGNVHGRFRVSAQETGTRKKYAAQATTAPDPNAPTAVWDMLPGSGKQRIVALYPSGTKAWVRMAVVRRGVQSAWCTAVLITVP